MKINENNTKDVKLKPVLDGDFWLIGGNPDLGELQGSGDSAKTGGGSGRQECVDHHVYKADDGMWHLWGCIRGTAVGRILYHWKASRLTDVEWEKTGEIIRADRKAGESINDARGQEWIQSPYIIRENGAYYMFFGGHGTGKDRYGNPVDRDSRHMESQICLMKSRDGVKWERHINREGYSRLFTGPGEARDPVLIKIGDLWHMYYTGHLFHGEEEIPTFFARTSRDLINWSDYSVVHYDRSSMFGKGIWNTECPHVVRRGGYYYLFRTENYALARTHVFRSKDPMDFGKGDSSEKYIGMIAVGAPEIIMDEEGNEYITSNHNLEGGTMMCRLRWDEDV
jgi:hypothetical protein